MSNKQDTIRKEELKISCTCHLNPDCELDGCQCMCHKRENEHKCRTCTAPICKYCGAYVAGGNYKKRDCLRTWCKNNRNKCDKHSFCNKCTSCGFYCDYQCPCEVVQR